MTVYQLLREQWIPAPLERVFPFFSRAENLERITPPWLGFQIATPLPIEIEPGCRIDYRLRLAGIPLRWRTLIASWDPPRCFVDLQERGPYALWEHAHSFRPLGDGVLMRDGVRYALPLGGLGRLAHAAVVRSALAAIFDYRQERVREIFARGDIRPRS